jgi:hypothetical protein
MKYELPVYILLIVLGLTVKKMDNIKRYFLVLFIATWILYSWQKG